MSDTVINLSDTGRRALAPKLHNRAGPSDTLKIMSDKLSKSTESGASEPEGGPGGRCGAIEVSDKS